MKKQIVTFIALALSGTGGQAESLSDAMKVDQVGYRTGFSKIAVVTALGSEFRSFRLRRVVDGQEVFRGEVTAPRQDPDSGDTTRLADFSAWDNPGEYYLDLGSLGKSQSFRISRDIYDRPYYLCARSFYGQRCGTKVNLGAQFPLYQHEACHVKGGYHPSSGKQGQHVSIGGWHDAGDYGRYVTNSSFSTALLLWALELFGNGHMKDIGLNLPESNGTMPDLLHETRWNLDWLFTMQDEDGGVWHKQTSEKFSGFVPPEKDNLPSLVIGSGKEPFKTTCATADFAAAMAVAARLFTSSDATYALRSLTAAKSAWKWALEHPTSLFRNPPGITTGEYGDANCEDDRLWAAAELARTTGEKQFQVYFREHYATFLESLSAEFPPGNTNVAPLALWSYALDKRSDQGAVERIRETSIAKAMEMVRRTGTSPYRNSLRTKNYVWGSNGIAAMFSVQLLIADRLHPDPQFVQAAAANLHYIFGRNALSICFVTQLGSKSVEHLHHRPSAGLPRPWPGLLSGGPNASREDEALQKRVPAGTPPAKVFLDELESYSSNETAINWNAALVFALAGLLAQP